MSLPSTKKISTLPHVRRQILKRNRAVRRQAAHARRLRATAGETGILERASVSENARRAYVTTLQKFWGFVARYGLDCREVPALDACLVDYCDMLYLDGEPCSVGDRLRVALECYHPELVR